MTTRKLINFGCLLLLALPTVGAASEAAAPGQTPLPPAPPPVAPAPPAEPTDAKRLGIPFVAQLEGPARPAANQEIDLQLSIERHLFLDEPLRISIELPAGVELVGGELEILITDGAPRLERTIRVSIGDAIPEDDLVVSVSQRGEGWGGHADKRYRFGRAEPVLERPEREGRPVIIDGKNYGRPIPIR